MTAAAPQLPKIDLSLVPEAIRPAIQAVLSLVEELLKENQLLRGRIDLLVRRYFGGQKNESISPAQLELLLQGFTQELLAAKPAPVSKAERTSEERTKSRPVRSGVPDHLPVRSSQVLVPDEVKANPEQFREIDSDTTRILDYEPGRFVCDEIVRPRFVRKETSIAVSEVQTPGSANPEAVILAAPLPNRLIEKGLPGPGLLAHVVLSRFEDHLPFYRLEKSFAERGGVHLSRQTMIGWVEALAEWFKPIVGLMKVEMFQTRYLQIDETPIRYLDRDEPGKSQLGYFWVFGRPGQDVIFDWQTSRSAECVKPFLEGYQGRIQCDGYGAYPSLAKQSPGVTLYYCVTHWRRKFIEAKDEDRRAGWFLLQLRHLYAIERRLRERKAGPRLREAVRAAEACPIWERLKKALALLTPKVLPQNRMGLALGYGTKLWDGLCRYVGDGEIEIDSNLIENAIRPTAIGKKNFLFIGHPDAGWRSAVMYSILGSCRRRGINPEAYLKDVLTRLPDMKAADLKDYTPGAWAKKHPEARVNLPK